MDSKRQESKQEWNGTGTEQSINAGSLQRIADATEKMASNYTQLQNERDLYKRLYNEKLVTINKLYRQISALKGVITKLKKKK